MPGISLPPKDRSQSIQEFFVGVDVGGTNIKIGVVTSRGRPLSHVVVPTEGEKGPEHGLAVIHRAIEQAVDDSPVRMTNIKAIGLATPGTLDIPNGILMEPANLPNWRHIPIRQRIADHYGKPTVLQNDANAAAFGEYWGGAGQGAHSLVLWTLGTGVGCGLIVNGQIVEGAHSHAGECGFLYIQMENGRPSATGMNGVLEGYCSTAGITSRTEEGLADGLEAPVMRAAIAAGEQVTPLFVAEAAEAGDPLANRILEDTARFMAYGTANLMHTIDPDVVLFGGNMNFGRNETELGRKFVERVRQEVGKLTFPVPAAAVRIDYAELGGQAGFIGAAGCAWAVFGAESEAVNRGYAV
ncbi:MAG: ROK family protein [Planctomycetaceae bacterium]